MCVHETWKSPETEIITRQSEEKHKAEHRLKPHRFHYVSVHTHVCVHVSDFLSDCVSTSRVPLASWCHNRELHQHSGGRWSQVQEPNTELPLIVLNRWWHSQGGEDSKRGDWPSQQGGFWNRAWAARWTVWVCARVCGGFFTGRLPRSVHPMCCCASIQTNVLSIRVVLFLALTETQSYQDLQRISQILGFKDWQLLVTTGL